MDVPSDRSHGAANEWVRARPGKPCVFLSFHGPDQLVATAVRIELESEGIGVLSYDPENRWPDGPFEMLRHIVEECHYVVYVGNRSIGSRFVRFELRIAAEFAIPVVRVASIAQVRRALPAIRLAATKEWPLDILWGRTVSRAVSGACQELTIDDIRSSAVNTAAKTGLDLFDRTFNRELDEAIRAKAALSPRDKVIIVAIAVTMLALACAGVTWLIRGILS